MATYQEMLQKLFGAQDAEASAPDNAMMGDNSIQQDTQTPKLQDILAQLQALKSPVAPSTNISAAQSDVAPDVNPPNQGDILMQQALALSNRPFYSQHTEIQPKSVDFGNTPSIASVEGLKEAQNAGNTASLISNAARGAAATAAAMSGTQNKFDQELADQEKFGQTIPQQYLQRVGMEKEDPNSAISKGYKQLASAMGFNITGNASASDIEKQFPQMANIYNQQNAQAARKDQFEEHRRDQNQSALMQAALRADMKQQTQGVQQDRADDKRLDTWSKTLAVPSSRSALGAAQNQIMGIDKIEAMINGHNIGDLTPQELQEVWAGLDRTITGTSSEYGRKALDPKTLATQWADLKQKVLNAPASADGQQFVSRLQQNLDLEKQQLSKTYTNIAGKNLSGAGDFAKRKPVEFKNFLAQQELPSELYYTVQGLTPPVKNSPQIQSNSQSNNIDTEKMFQGLSDEQLKAMLSGNK